MLNNPTAKAPRHRRSRLLGWGATVLVVLVGVGVAPAVPAAAADGQLTVTGRGWGHGRGMGQYGALGYAVDHGWTSTRILEHFYSNTSAGSVGTPSQLMSVELTALTNKRLRAAGTSILVAGEPVPAGVTAVEARTLAGGQVEVKAATGCSGATGAVIGTYPGGVSITTASQASYESLIRVCEADGGQRAYRGRLTVQEHAVTRVQTTFNYLRVDNYLKGVVPRESPASWGSLPNGMAALEAQAVAARSYALSGHRDSGADTCDTTACQVYGGAARWVTASSPKEVLEHENTDAAIAATAGQIRRMNANNAIARTEFSSSTGGYTAGGTFPAVPDAGDDTSRNPNHTWSTTMSMSTVAAKLGTGDIRSIAVTGRNGLGADGGRVTQVTVIAGAGQTVRFTGNEVRSKLGLKSDWFVLSGVTGGEAAAVVRALYQDILGREPDPSGLEGWTALVLQTGDARVVANGIVMSTERLHTFIRAEYRAALKRAPEAAGLAHWTSYLQAGTSVPELQIYIYASDEALLNLGRGDLRRWVDGVYRGILGRSASDQDRAYWAGIATREGRAAVVRYIAMSDEAGLRRLDSYYQTMLGRRPDPSGISTFLPLMRGNGDFVLPIFIGGSPEYWARAQIR